MQVTQNTPRRTTLCYVDFYKVGLRHLKHNCSGYRGEMRPVREYEIRGRLAHLGLGSYVDLLCERVYARRTENL